MKVFRIILQSILAVIIIGLILSSFIQNQTLEILDEGVDFHYAEWKTEFDSINELNAIIDSLETEIKNSNSQ
jgi:hypothetical protein